MYNLLNYDTVADFFNENPQPSAQTTSAPNYECFAGVPSNPIDYSILSKYSVRFPYGTRDINRCEVQEILYQYMTAKSDYVLYELKTPSKYNFYMDEHGDKSAKINLGDYLIIHEFNFEKWNIITKVVEGETGQTDDVQYRILYGENGESYSAITSTNSREYPDDFKRDILNNNGYYALHMPEAEDLKTVICISNTKEYPNERPLRPVVGTTPDDFISYSKSLYYYISKIDGINKAEINIGLIDGRPQNPLEFPSGFTVFNKQYFGYEWNRKGTGSGTGIFHKFFTEGQTGYTEGIYNKNNKQFKIRYDYQIIYEESDTGKTKPYYAPLHVVAHDNDILKLDLSFNNSEFILFDTIVNFDQEGETGTTLTYSTGSNYMFVSSVDMGNIDNSLYVTKIKPGVAYVEEDKGVHYNKKKEKNNNTDTGN